MLLIIASSHLFLANAVLAYTMSNDFVKYTMCVVYLSSVLHWTIYEPNSMLHYADMVVSRMATMLLIVYSTKYVHYYYSILALHTIVLTYGMSRCVYVLYPDHWYWVWWHVHFHIMTNFSIYVFLLNYRNYKWYGVTNNL